MGSFAQRLRDAMQSAGLKAVDLHERTGISKASISEYLSGNYEPKQKNVYRLAEALHVAPSYLMGLSEQEPPTSPAPPEPQKSIEVSPAQKEDREHKHLQNLLSDPHLRRILESSGQLNESSLQEVQNFIDFQLGKKKQ